MLTVNEIKRFIDNDNASLKKKAAKVGVRYYEAEHDIMNCRLFYYDTDGELKEDKTRSNIKISHPFFTELVDQTTAYILSFKENPIRAKEDIADKLQPHLDEYFDDEFWAEIGELLTGVFSKGFEYMHAYKNEEDRLAFECSDSMGVIEVEKRFAKDGLDHILYWYIDKVDIEGKKIKKIMDCTSEETGFYIQTDEGAIKKDKNEGINPKPHVVYEEADGVLTYEGFEFVPFFRMDNNKKQTSDLKAVKGIIDDYDLHACSLSNNLKDFDTPLHVVSGFEGDNLDELQQNLKTKKLVGVGEGGGIEVRTVEIPYQARKEKLEIDEKNIYRFGFGLNTSGLKDTAATTNIAIKAAYSLLDMKANKATIRLKRFLKDPVKVVLDEINKTNGTGYTMNDVYFEFERSVMTNETENIANKKVEAEIKQLEINTILNVATNVDDEHTLKAICDVMEWNFEEIKTAVEKANEGNIDGARKTLEGVVIDEE